MSAKSLDRVGRSNGASLPGTRCRSIAPRSKNAKHRRGEIRATVTGRFTDLASAARQFHLSSSLQTEIVMQIDPRMSFALNLMLMIVSGVATGAVHFTGLVSDPVAAAIIGWAGIATFLLSTVNTALHGYSSASPGPFV